MNKEQLTVEEASSTYQLAADNCRLPKGYKQTEVGVIPEDWISSTIGNVVSFSGGSQPPRSVFKFNPTNGYIRLIQIRDYKSDDYESYIPELLARKWCDAKDIMIGRYGPPIFQILRGLDGAYNVALIKTEPSCKIDREFLFYILKQEKLFQLMELLSRRSSGQTGVDLPALKNYGLPLPSLPEQRAIATVLSDVDALLAKFDQLITKKRDLKLAAMQQLLTGQTRLPGFSSDWLCLNMSKHASLKARIGWQSLTTQEYLESGTHFLVTGTDFINGLVNWSTCHFIDEWRYSQDRNIQLMNGDVLITKDGTIGKVGYVEELSLPATLNSGVFVIRPLHNSFVPQFLFYVLTSKIFDEFLSKITAGSTITHLYQKDFVTFEFYAPNLEEQIAIATILSDMDTEITALEARRDKSRDLKQGMMQELLTGRIRLI